MNLIMIALLSVLRVEPANWWAGMKDPALQIMVYGQGLAGQPVSVDGAKLDSVAATSPNYMLLYLDLTDTPPGEITLTVGAERIPYNIYARTRAGEDRQGFTNADALYLLMPDRFCNGNAANDNALPGAMTNPQEPSLRHGGDLEGIRQHLDYFNELGVTALWFTPVLENASPDNGTQSTYHGYATTDYYRVDPRFGTNQEYIDLIAAAHERGLKVVMDMIFNHCGLEHPWVADPPAADWFNPLGQTSYKLTPVLDPYASQYDMAETVDGWFVPSMPDLNQRNPHVARYLTQNSIWWIETADIDGIRMDTYPYAHGPAMAQWMQTLDAEYPNFNVVGETWVTEPAFTAAYQTRTPLKTVMDFALYDRLDQAKTEQTDEWWKGLNRVYNSLCYDFLYDDPSRVLAFIENHDTDRFLGDGDDTAALRQALALLLTVNRIPQLYYGTEILMNGTKTITDGNVRKDFPPEAFDRRGRTPQQQEMFLWLSRLLHWRQGNELISQGRQVQFIPYMGVYVICRIYGERACLTILNGTDEAATLHRDRYAEVLTAPSGTDVITGQTVRLTEDIELAPRQTLIIEI